VSERRGGSIFGSRVLNSRYPKAKNKVGRRIEGKLISIDPIGDTISEFRVSEVGVSEALHLELAK
jgi:hypothetical protein